MTTSGSSPSGKALDPAAPVATELHSVARIGIRNGGTGGTEAAPATLSTSGGGTFGGFLLPFPEGVASGKADGELMAVPISSGVADFLHNDDGRIMLCIF
jgi:hypothetical protein